MCGDGPGTSEMCTSGTGSTSSGQRSGALAKRGEVQLVEAARAGSREERGVGRGKQRSTLRVDFAFTPRRTSATVRSY